MKATPNQIAEMEKKALERGGTSNPHTVLSPIQMLHAKFDSHNIGRPQSFTFKGVVMGKPRMTQKDKWAQRPAVVRYRAFADALRTAAGIYGKCLETPQSLSWNVYLPMPASWSQKKKSKRRGTGHRTKPDRDNIDKGILDALFVNDSGIYAGVLGKFWEDSCGPRLVVSISW